MNNYTYFTLHILKIYLEGKFFNMELLGQKIGAFKILMTKFLFRDF